MASHEFVPLTDIDKRISGILSPIKEKLRVVHVASKKNIPDDEKRLKMIKQGLLTIGNHINTQVREKGLADIEEKIWDYVSLHHWPQSKSVEKRVPGPKLKEMYKKLGGKDANNAGSKITPPKPKQGPPPTPASMNTNGTSPGVKSEPKIEAKSEDTEMRDVKTEAPATETKREVDVKSEGM